MLTEICRYLRNYFEKNVIFDSFVVSDGALIGWDTRLSDVLQSGQYYRIVGSVFNDGVHKFGEDNLVPERAFDGAVWVMTIPPDLVALDAEITDWIAKNENAINSPYQSESFGGYSYSKGYSGATAQGVTWQSQFAARLAPWRKI